ncbi:hypothetical protein PA25_27800 [Pseudoalteromonas sp. A25]|uniref:hypothetical protein n=1 Tax=Pseudoalteromonas sp. A25 TaxID=116092 RepID=UPI0012604561|nr:hypothetical protein [Pseudoalteromonas sp. A25]BBN82795.1 hypothetical protein PA25_27800 [Pseudoalteromonas sp. A25]
MNNLAKKICTASALAACISTSAFANTVYTSDSSVTAWDVMFPNPAYSNWTSACTVEPDVGLDANWQNPHPAFSFGHYAHPWQGYVGNFASWINAWSNISSQGPYGQNWTKYAVSVTGQGEFVLKLLADNCSWVYIDGTLVGFQSASWSASNITYPVSLDGEHNLEFLIFDGGGLAGGMFRLETNTGTSFPDSDGDGLTDPEEILTQTDPNNPDSDGDGFSDGEEVDAGSNPNDANDAPVVDSDGDGVLDDNDMCNDTAAGALIDENGCSGVQNVANACNCAGPTIDLPWKNHGQYVSCVAHAKNIEVANGLLTDEEGDALTEAAGESECGKKSNGKGK